MSKGAEKGGRQRKLYHHGGAVYSMPGSQNRRNRRRRGKSGLAGQRGNG